MPTPGQLELGASSRNLYKLCLSRFDNRSNSTQEGTHRKSIRFTTTWKLCSVFSYLIFYWEEAYRVASVRSPISLIQLPSDLDYRASICFAEFKLIELRVDELELDELKLDELELGELELNDLELDELELNDLELGELELNDLELDELELNDLK
uniref:Uncharacterized protein n=1 Tax=Hyaloperonospora arabidopsidis (strain Emoy2) TaxID=559515 RepID=M4BM96_HYAAE